MSERNYEDECGDHGGRTNAGEPCGLAAGWGTDNDSGRCKHCLGTSSDGESHAGNDNATTHGAFKEHFRSDLTDEEKAAIDSLVSHLRDITDERALAAEVAAEALIKYKRSADSRFLREARQWFAEFNLIPNEDKIEASGPDGSPIMVLERERDDE